MRRLRRSVLLGCLSEGLAQLLILSRMNDRSRKYIAVLAAIVLIVGIGLALASLERGSALGKVDAPAADSDDLSRPDGMDGTDAGDSTGEMVDVVSPAARAGRADVSGGIAAVVLHNARCEPLDFRGVGPERVESLLSILSQAGVEVARLPDGQLQSWFDPLVERSASNGFVVESTPDGLDRVWLGEGDTRYFARQRPSRSPNWSVIDVFPVAAAYLIPPAGQLPEDGALVRVTDYNTLIRSVSGAAWGGAGLAEWRVFDEPVPVPCLELAESVGAGWVSLEGCAWIPFDAARLWVEDLQLDCRSAGSVAVRLIGSGSMSAFGVRLRDSVGRIVWNVRDMAPSPEGGVTCTLDSIAPGAYTLDVVAQAATEEVVESVRVQVLGGESANCVVHLPNGDSTRIRTSLLLLSARGDAPDLSLARTVSVQPEDVEAVLNGADQVVIMPIAQFRRPRGGISRRGLLARVPRGLPRGVYRVSVDGAYVASIVVGDVEHRVHEISLPDKRRIRVVVTAGGEPVSCEELNAVTRIDGAVTPAQWRPVNGEIGQYTVECLTGQLLLAGRVSGYGKNAVEVPVHAGTSIYEWRFERTREVALAFRLRGAPVRLSMEALAEVADDDKGLSRPSNHGVRFLGDNFSDFTCSGFTITVEAECQELDLIFPEGVFLHWDDTGTPSPRLRVKIDIGSDGSTTVDLARGTETTLERLR